MTGVWRPVRAMSSPSGLTCPAASTPARADGSWPSLRRCRKLACRAGSGAGHPRGRSHRGTAQPWIRRRTGECAGRSDRTPAFVGFVGFVVIISSPTMPSSAKISVICGKHPHGLKPILRPGCARVRDIREVGVQSTPYPSAAGALLSGNGERPGSCLGFQGKVHGGLLSIPDGKRGDLRLLVSE
jgi:hypothetical protein